MQAAALTELVSVADYLAAETGSRERHEYLGGMVYAMAGETLAHNQLAQNLLILLRQGTRNGPCRTYINDVRVHLNLHSDEYFYYPDLVVTRDKRDQPGDKRRFVQHPRLIIEVLSESTERTDKREKFFAYTQIETLEEYVLVAQAAREVTVFRRANQWKAEVYAGAKAVAVLKSLKLRLPLKEIYEGV